MSGQPTPVGQLLRAAAAGHFPPADGGFHRAPPWRPGLEAVLAFTGHAVLAVGDDVSDDELRELGVDGLGGAHHPRVLCRLAGPSGWIDSLDAVLVSTGTGTDPAPSSSAGLEHPRVRFASAVRDDVRAVTTEFGVVTVARGLGGLIEVGIEAEHPGTGTGPALVAAARDLVPAGETVVAAVAPGHAASLRAFLAGGFLPVASVQLVRPERHRPDTQPSPAVV